MTDNTDSNADHLPLDDEDAEILKEVFPDELWLPSVRTGKQVNMYLTKDYYVGGKGTVEQIALRKAERRCQRDYPSPIRDTERLYEQAEAFFRRWWSRLEDGSIAPIDEYSRHPELRATIAQWESGLKAAEPQYVNQFVETYSAWVRILDMQHPEHRDAYRRRRDEHIAHLQRAGRVRKDNSDYLNSCPRWRQNVAAEGRTAGAQSADDDREIGIGFRHGPAVNELAKEQFSQWWQEIMLFEDFEYDSLFNYPELRTIYTQNCINTYTGDTTDESASQTARARIVNTRYSDGVRLYTVELTDPKYGNDPLIFEVAKQLSGGDTELRESDTQ